MLHGSPFVSLRKYMLLSVLRLDADCFPLHAEKRGPAFEWLILLCMEIMFFQ